MKNTLLFFVFLALLASCQKEELEEAQPELYPQTWQLVKLRSGWTNTVLTGAALTYQETYVFRADSTFTKTRQIKGELIEASGTFSVPTATRPYTLLTYTTKNNLIGSCSSYKLQEGLFTKSDTLINSWEACDGPRLYYKRVASQGK